MQAPLFEEFGDGFKATLFRKVSNVSEKVSNTSEKVGNTPEKVSNDFEKYLSLLRKENTTAIFINNIEKVFEQCGTDVVFGRTNVIEKVAVFRAGKYKFLKL